MRIIELGDIEFLSMCPDCHTKWAMFTHELEKSNDNTYSVKCPLCGKEIFTDNCDGVLDFIKKRNELKEILK